MSKFLVGMIGLTIGSFLTIQPAFSQVPGEGGLHFSGRLEPGDRQLNDNSYYDLYRFSGQVGDRVTISMTSSDFDTYLLLRDPSGTVIMENDDASRNNRNSQVSLTLPFSGEYTVITNSYGAEEQGNYSLTISSEQVRVQSTNSSSNRQTQHSCGDDPTLEDASSESLRFEEDRYSFSFEFPENYTVIEPENASHLLLLRNNGESVYLDCSIRNNIRGIGGAIDRVHIEVLQNPQGVSLSELVPRSEYHSGYQFQVRNITPITIGGENALSYETIRSGRGENTVSLDAVVYHPDKDLAIQITAWDYGSNLDFVHVNAFNRVISSLTFNDGLPPVLDYYPNVAELGLIHLLDANRQAVVSYRTLQGLLDGDFAREWPENNFLDRPFIFTDENGEAFSPDSIFNPNVSWSDYLKLRVDLANAQKYLSAALSNVYFSNETTSYLSQLEAAGYPSIRQRWVATAQAWQPQKRGDRLLNAWDALFSGDLDRFSQELDAAQLGEVVSQAFVDASNSTAYLLWNSVNTGVKLVNAFDPRLSTANSASSAVSALSNDRNLSPAQAVKIIDYIQTLETYFTNSALAIQDLSKIPEIRDSEEQRKKTDEVLRTTQEDLAEIISATIMLAEPDELGRSGQGALGLSRLANTVFNLRQLSSLLCSLGNSAVLNCSEDSQQFADVMTTDEHIVLTLTAMAITGKTISSGLDAVVSISNAAVSIPNAAVSTAVRQYATKIDALATALQNATNVTFQSIMRQRYEAMQNDLALNLRVARELDNEVSQSSREIGQLLLQNRSDVVVELPDGRIGVRTTERIYPNSR
jgi:hypothetical protein